MNDDVLTRNENQELAVRTVSVTEGSNASSYDDVFTRDTNGKLAVRVVGNGGGGGSDPHNLGWYATQSALETAHPTAEDGDWAIVGSTDTVWVWDSDTNAWKDTDQKGQVESVNGQTGTVVLTASDVGAATTAQGAKADTAVQPGDLATVATTGSYDDLTDKPTIPAAQVNSDWDAVSGVAQILNKPTIPTVGDGTITITQGGVTKGTFTTNQSGNTTIEVDAGGGSSYTAGTGIDITSGVISVTSPTLQNTATGNYSMCIGQTGSSASGQNSLAVGSYAQSTQRSVAVGASAVANVNYTVAVGDQAGCYGGQGAVALGSAARANAANAIQISATSNVSVNSDANTMKVANANGNFEIMSADGTIPTARLTKVNSTITLTAAGWSSNSQTVNVTGMTATGVVMVSPDPTDQSAYTSAGILCTAQAAGTLTFSCDTVPSGDLSVNVVML